MFPLGFSLFLAHGGPQRERHTCLAGKVLPFEGVRVRRVPARDSLDGRFEVPEALFLDGRGQFRSEAAETRRLVRDHAAAGLLHRGDDRVDVEIIDLRSLWPLDLPTLVASVKKTGRCVIVHEATRTSGFGAELAALMQEHCFYHLEAPIERVAGWDTPYPHALEWMYFPGPDRVGASRW